MVTARSRSRGPRRRPGLSIVVGRPEPLAVPPTHARARRQYERRYGELTSWACSGARADARRRPAAHLSTSRARLRRCERALACVRSCGAGAWTGPLYGVRAIPSQAGAAFPLVSNPYVRLPSAPHPRRGRQRCPPAAQSTRSCTREAGGTTGVQSSPRKRADGCGGSVGVLARSRRGRRGRFIRRGTAAARRRRGPSGVGVPRPGHASVHFCGGWGVGGRDALGGSPLRPVFVGGGTRRNVSRPAGVGLDFRVFDFRGAGRPGVCGCGTPEGGGGAEGGGGRAPAGSVRVQACPPSLLLFHKIGTNQFFFFRVGLAYTSAAPLQYPSPQSIFQFTN